MKKNLLNEGTEAQEMLIQLKICTFITLRDFCPITVHSKALAQWKSPNDVNSLAIPDERHHAAAAASSPKNRPELDYWSVFGVVSMKTQYYLTEFWNFFNKVEIILLYDFFAEKV